MTRSTWLVAVGLVVGVMLGSTLVFGRLPDQVPTHWNLQGEIDGHGSRAVAFVIPTFLIGLLGLFAILPVISPTQFSMNEFRATYGAIVMILLAMLAFVQAVALMGALGYQFDMSRVMTAGDAPRAWA